MDKDAKVFKAMIFAALLLVGSPRDLRAEGVCVDPHPPVIWQDLQGIQHALKTSCDLIAESPKETEAREREAAKIWRKLSGQALEPVPKPATATAAANPGVDFGLTAFERALIRQYTESGSDKINGILRFSPSKRAEIAPLVDSLDRALARLPNYQGVVYRGTAFNSVMDQQFQKGKVVPDPAFVSATRDRAIAKEFGLGASFVIRSRTGKLIDRFSARPDEQEVLFRPGTRFKVLSRVKTPEGVEEIVLDEVGP